MTLRYLFAASLAIVTSIADADSQSPQAAADQALAIKAEDPSLQWGPCPPILAGDCRIAVLHGDPSQPGADIFLRVGGGYVIANHVHTSAERMILVSGRLQVQYRGMPVAVLAPGQYAYGPAQAPHGGQCISREPCTLFIAFVGPVDAELFNGSLQ